MAIDALVSGTSSDSYSTVLVADAYHAAHLYGAPWVALSTDSKERGLKMATRLLDERVTWYGLKTTETQALRWPRSGVVSVDVFSILSDIVPHAISNATAELARHLAATDSTVEALGKGIASLNAGSVSLTFDKGDVADVIPAIVKEMLRGWGIVNKRSSFGAVPLVRT